MILSLQLGDLNIYVFSQIAAYPKTTAILVRNHGIYIWGDTWISAKTQVSILTRKTRSRVFVIPQNAPVFGPRRGEKEGCLILEFLK